MNVPEYIPIQSGFTSNGDLVVVYRLAQPVQREVDFTKQFYGRKLNSEQFRLAQLVRLPKQRLKLHSAGQHVQAKDEDDGEVEL